jgi:uncharacterized protein affecting Mg2+/Co2+ transport
MLKNQQIKQLSEEKMKSLINLPVLSLAIAGLLLAGTAAKADPLTITLAAPFQSGVMDEVPVFAFDATVTNNSSSTVYLNADDWSVTAPLTVDDSPFDNNYPLSLGAGDSFTGVLFNVDVPSGTPQGLYTGTFEILGGGPTDDTDVAGAATFNVQITPEPSSLLLMVSGLGALAGTLRRRLVR